MNLIMKWKKIKFCIHSCIAFSNISFPLIEHQIFFSDCDIYKSIMDLLGSIMGSMDASKPKPPPMSEKEKLQKKKQKEMFAKIEEKERQAKLNFRTKIENKINEFLKKDNDKTLKFEAMDKYHRSVVHDVSEVAGLVSHSFGEEDVDRHIQVWKKEFSPGDDELATLRRGEEWDPVKFQQEKTQREWRDKLEEERSRALNKVSINPIREIFGAKKPSRV